MTPPTPTRLLRSLPARAVGLGLGLVLLTSAWGCAPLRYLNETPILHRHIRASHDPAALVMFKASVLVPARDILTLDPLWRRIFGDEAWNALDGGEVADSSFYTNRRPEELLPERLARGPWNEEPPRPPFEVIEAKAGGATPGFIGRDARGRTYLFKLDHPDYPELGTSAAVIGARVLWALGYHVPPVYLVRITGTGDPRYDGRRATATRFLDHVRGHFHFDWFRYRRELRGLRLACAWINDTDRVGSNTLVVENEDQATCYLIDFNSCLGSWQGEPKAPWRGWRHEWDYLGWGLVQVLTFGLVRPEPDPHQPVVSPAVGRFESEHFDPLRWRPQVPNNAFEHMTREDMRWIVARIRRLDRPRLEAIVSAAELSRPEDARYLVETLWRRRAKILALVREPGAPTPADPLPD